MDLKNPMKVFLLVAACYVCSTIAETREQFYIHSSTSSTPVAGETEVLSSTQLASSRNEDLGEAELPSEEPFTSARPQDSEEAELPSEEPSTSARTPVQRSRAEIEVATENLWIAVKGNDSAAVQSAIKSGADLERRYGEFGMTPLHWAAWKGYVEIMDVLMDAGADIEAVGNAGNRPLHVAAFWGRSKAVSRLIEAGADVNARGNKGGTPLFLAAQEDQVGTMELLLRAGADIEAVDSGDRALHWAAYYGRNRAVALLVLAGADIHALGNGGETPLQAAAANNKSSTVELLRALGAQR